MSIFDFFKGLGKAAADPVETAVKTLEPGPRHPEPARPDPVESDPVESATDDEIADTIEELFAREPAEGIGVTTDAGEDYDQAAVRELFSDIAGNQAKPVKDLILELRRGDANSDWIDVCRPVMTTLIRSADSMGLAEAAKKMMEFDETLSLAVGGNGSSIEPAAGATILSAYEEMARTLPGAFQVETADERREAILIHSLLQQVPGVGRVTFDRLYEAGLTTLDALLAAGGQDLAAATGIAEFLCQSISDRIQEYGKSQGIEGAEEHALARLGELIRDLRGEHEELERTVMEEWSDPSFRKNKRDCRKRRQMCALQIEVLLADLGEVTLVSRIQEMPFGARIELLEQFVADRSAVSAEA